MNFTFLIRPHQLRVASNWLLNLSAGWFASIFLTNIVPNALIFVFLSISCLKLSLICERLLDEL